jgi:hypothetical protein
MLQEIQLGVGKGCALSNFVEISTFHYLQVAHVYSRTMMFNSFPVLKKNHLHYC